LISRNWNVSTYLRPTNPGTLAADRTEPGAEFSETNTDMTPEICVAARSVDIKKERNDGQTQVVRMGGDLRADFSSTY
jgi:hypothetical protein